MAQNKNKPKRSKAERLAKKHRNRHLAELKLLEKRNLATIQQKQELSNMIARKRQQQQRKFKELEKPQIPTTKSAEPLALIDREEPDIKGKYKVISTGEPEEYNPIQAAKDLAEAITEEDANKFVREELVDILNEQEDIPDLIKKRVNDYWTDLNEQKKLAIFGTIHLEARAQQQQKVESALQITDIYQSVIDTLMASLPTKTQDYLLNCVNELINEVGLDVVQQRLYNNQYEISSLILEPWEQYENLEKIEKSARGFLDVIYANHVPSYILSRLDTYIELEEPARIYWSHKKGLFYLR